MPPTDQTAVIEINALGLGWHQVPIASNHIEMVRVHGPHGNPHVLTVDANHSMIEVLGAIPDTQVRVSWRQPT